MAETKTLKLKVVGEQTMHCMGCETAVRFTLSMLPGVRGVEVDHKTQAIEIDYGSNDPDLEKVMSELEWIGYQVEAE